MDKSPIIGLEKKSGNVLFTIFAAIFCFTFTILVGSVIFNQSNGYIPTLIVLLIFFFISLIYLIYRLLSNKEQILERYYKIIIIAGLAVFLTANIITGFALRFQPVFDLGSIFTGASEWVSTGSFMDKMDPTCDPDYFYLFPHNLGGLLFLFIPFKIASWFGVTDYYAVAMIFNALLATATMLCVVLITKRLLGVRQSVMALILILMTPPFYFIAPTFYTDSLSLVFPVLIIYLYLRYADSEKTSAKIIFASLIGLACAVGMLAKFTVLIALIAVVIYHICTKGVVSVLPIAAASAVIILGVYALFNAYFYANHLDKEKAEQLNMPYTHWIMVSLSGEGRYNPQDNDFTRSFSDTTERDAAIMDRIKTRIDNYGITGMLSLFYKKGIVSFSDGTLAQSDFLDDSPVNETSLHSFVLYEGKEYINYKHICSGIYFAMQLLMLAGAYCALFLKKWRVENILPLLCVFGIMLFLMIWEVSGRHATNFVPLILISAIFGLDAISGIFERKQARI